MGALTTARIREAAAEYAEREPFATVETERLETLPDAFRDGTFLWKDAEWVVRWFARRSLDGRIHPAESAFRDNEWDDLEAAIADAVEAVGRDGLETTDVDALESALDALTRLEGVDVPVASAFLYHVDPDRYLVVDHRLWNALATHSSLEMPPPDPVEIDHYERYLEHVREVAQRHEVDPVTLYRALWRLESASE